MKALYRVPPDDPVVSAFIPLSTDVIACHGIPASNVYAENPPKSSGKPGALYFPDSPPPDHPRKGAGYHKNSSTEAKIQNDRKRNVDRAVFGGGRYDRGRCERRASIVKTCACRDRGDKEVGTARVFLTDSIINCPA